MDLNVAQHLFLYRLWTKNSVIHVMDLEVENQAVTTVMQNVSPSEVPVLSLAVQHFKKWLYYYISKFNQ